MGCGGESLKGKCDMERSIKIKLFLRENYALRFLGVYLFVEIVQLEEGFVGIVY